MLAKFCFMYRNYLNKHQQQKFITSLLQKNDLIRFDVNNALIASFMITVDKPVHLLFFSSRVLITNTVLLSVKVIGKGFEPTTSNLLTSFVTARSNALRKIDIINFYLFRRGKKSLKIFMKVLVTWPKLQQL